MNASRSVLPAFVPALSSFRFERSRNTADGVRSRRWFQAALIATALVLSTHTAIALSADEFAAIAVGKTFSANRDGRTVNMTFNADGSLSMRAGIMRMRGAWEYVGEELCVTFDRGPRKGTNCTHLTRTGANQLTGSDGMVLVPR